MSNKKCANPPKWAYAPYNFIPFDENPHRRYEKIEDLPPHNIWDPTLLSGEMTITITAETPIFVGNGKKDTDSDFHRNLDGNYAIPGSTLRGLIRENMQILGAGAVRKDEDFQDYRLLYRRMTDASDSLGAPLKDNYKAQLGTKSRPVQNVKPGYLCYDGEDRYYIVPVNRVFFAKRDDEQNEAWKNVNAANMDVYFKEERRSVTVNGKTFQVRRTVLSETEQDGYEKGVVHCVGWMKNKKHPEFDQNTLYVFPELQKEAEGFLLSEKDIINYKEDYKARINTLGDKKDFWALPETENVPVPVFYCQHADHTDFGMSRYLRIAYNRSLLEGLPEGQRQAFDESGESPFIDYAYAIMGFSGKKKSYRSRVSVGDFLASEQIKPGNLYSVKLGEPKISFFPGYSQNGMDYNKEAFRFRGYKQYWLKAEEKLEAFEPKGDKSNKEDKSSFPSTMRPLPAGTVFTGKIRYRNLSPDELGLLFWSLTLEEDCRQNIGRGKPLGYGRVRITVTNLREYDPAKLYGAGNLLAAPADSEHKDERVKELIDFYKSAHGMLEELPSTVLDFLYMKKLVAPVRCFSYMDLHEFRNLNAALPTVTEYREKQVVPSNGPDCVQEYRSGAIVKAVITRIEEFGFFVKLEDGICGLVHISEIGRKENKVVCKGMVDQYFSLGETVKVKVLPPRDGKLSLSYKQANP